MIDVLSLWLHLLAAMAWIGGMVLVGVILVPITRGMSDHALRYDLVGKVGVRFKYLAWASMALLLITGLYSALAKILSWDMLLGTGYGKTLLLKGALFLLMIALSAIHDFYLGPKVVAMGARAASARESAMLSYLARGNLLVGLVVLYLAVSLRKGGIF